MSREKHGVTAYYFRVILVEQDDLMAKIVKLFTNSKYSHIATTDFVNNDHDMFISFDPVGFGYYEKPEAWKNTKYSVMSFFPMINDSEFTRIRWNKYSYWQSIKSGIIHHFPIFKKFFKVVNNEKTNCVGFICKVLKLPEECHLYTPERLFNYLENEYKGEQ